MLLGSKFVVGKFVYQYLLFECSFGVFCGVLRFEKFIFFGFIVYFIKFFFYRNKILLFFVGVNINNIKSVSFDLINILILLFVE